MNCNVVSVKIEPPDDLDTDTSTSPALQNGITEKEGVSQGIEQRGDVYNDSRNFTCLLCDIVCKNRDDLRKHLKNSHASKTYSTMSTAMLLNKVSSDTSSRAFSGYVNYRYTCPVCGAKFKSFRTYLTHNMSHRGTSGLQPFDEARMVALFGTGKQYMQDYLEADEGCAGTFTCSECKTVFVQRDAYAMHMMMRAMNETCKSNNNLHESTPQVSNNESGAKHKTDGTEKPTMNQTQILLPVAPKQTPQRCLEDVTAKIDQDEYLKSVLDKVCTSDVTKLDIPSYNMDDRKVCSFCRDSFIDQDSLAMHVMSDHAEEMSLTSNRNTNVSRGSNPEDYINWMAIARPLIMNSVCRYCNETFMSRDSLALHMLTHAHLDEKLSAKSRNNFKRKSDVIETSLSMPEQPKILRFNSDIHAESGHPNRLSISDEKGKVEVNSNMYCKECDIKFYALSEFDWHRDRHREGNVNSYDLPLCLTKHSDGNHSVNTVDSVNDIPDDNNRRRRNSFSSCGQTDKLATSDMLPKRPVSVGDCSTDTLQQLSKNHVEQPKTEHRKEVKESVNDSVLKTINALSSSEQRIIYSVFGNDLGLNAVKSENTSTLSNPCSPPVDLSSAKTSAVNDKEVVNKDSRASLDVRNYDRDISGSDLTKTIETEARQIEKPGDSNNPMCKYCEILFFNKAIYYLHMGLHNVNNPWQCNICGKICQDAVDFAAHVIHM